MTFTVTLSPASGREVKVNWATADGTATAGSDYTARQRAADLRSGRDGQDDRRRRPRRRGHRGERDAQGHALGPGRRPAVNVLDGEGAGTIVDKNAPPSLSISDTTRTEGGGATFTVTLAGTTLRTVTVSFNTTDGTAKAGSDYAARTGTLTFAPGEKSKTIAVIDHRRHGGRARRGVLRRDRRRRQRDDHEEPRRGIDRGQRPSGHAADDRSDDPTTDKPPVAKPATVLVPRMILGPRTVSIGANGMARMLVTCQKLSPIGCAGSVELERATKPLLKLGKKTFTVKKGAKGYASIKLNLKTLKLLQKNGTMRAKVIVLVKTSTKTMKVSPGIITLKATRALKNAKLKPPAPSTKVVVDP